MNIFKITILFIILFFICIKTNAAPAISSISGSISHGSSITINGTGFGVKSPAAPYIWANFDDGSSQPSSLGQIHSWTVNNFTPTAGVGVRNTIGMQSYLWNYQEQNFGALMGVNGVNFNTYGLHWYVFRKGKRNWSITDSMNWKNFRLWYDGGSLYTQTGNGNIAEEGYPNAGYMCAWQSPPSSQCTDSITVDQTRGYSDGRWNTEQYIGAPQSGAGLTDGFFHFIVNGRTAVRIPYTDYAQKVFVMAQGSASESYFVHDESANDPDPPAGARTWWDDVYVDRTWSRVMLSNRSTWGTSSTGPLYEIQIPTAWSNTSVTVKVNIGELNIGSTAYLYVVDSNNDANSSGFPVTIGGGGQSILPVVLGRSPVQCASRCWQIRRPDPPHQWWTQRNGQPQTIAGFGRTAAADGVRRMKWLVNRFKEPSTWRTRDHRVNWLLRWKHVEVDYCKVA